MTMSEHLPQTDLDWEPRERVDEWATRQLVRDTVGESRARAKGFELVTMDPAAKWPAHLFVHEQARRLVDGVPRQPADDARDTQFHFGTALDAAGAPDHADRGERRAEQGERIVPLVKCEDGRHRRVDLDLPDEGGHTP
jgi:hypothetical protein